MAQAKKFTMSSSPHIAGKDTTQRIMLDVLIALVPAVLAGTFFFGLYSLLLVALTTACCVGAEYLYCVLRGRKHTLWDLSAAVTGVLLALNFPPTAPLFFPVVGALIAIPLTKMLFGGIGKNFANPALTARIVMFLAWGGLMSRFIAPINYSAGFSGFFNFSYFYSGADVVTSATPLNPNQSVALLDLFVGRHAGVIGETSALALIIGGIYLCIRRVIHPGLPLAVIASAAVFMLVFGTPLNAILPAVLSGGLMIGAIFMATDYSSSPNTILGTVIYAVLIGFLTAFFRKYAAMPEGVSFAILLGNIIVPLLDRHLIPKPFGHVSAGRRVS